MMVGQVLSSGKRCGSGSVQSNPTCPPSDNWSNSLKNKQIQNIMAISYFNRPIPKCHNAWDYYPTMYPFVTEMCTCIVGYGSGALWDLHNRSMAWSKIAVSQVEWWLEHKHSWKINSLAPGQFEWNFRYVIFKQILVIDGWGISCEIALIWMSRDFTDDQSTLVQVMAWCRQATSHYLSQCWPRSMSPNSITRPQWVNSLPRNKSTYCYKNLTRK